MPSLIIIHDGDNTLWDTNSVFRRAQLTMLEGLGLLQDPRSGPSMLLALREIDREIWTKTGKFEYDPILLALELAHRLGNMPHDVAAQSETVKAAYSGYLRASRQIPRLLPHARSYLEWLKAKRTQHPAMLISVLFTEGDPVRLQQIVQRHGFLPDGDAVDMVYMQRKTEEGFRDAIEKGKLLLRQDAQLHPKVIVVGDSLERDIALGNAVGAVTIYKPAGFHGRELAVAQRFNPTFTISSLAQLPRIITTYLTSNEHIEIPPMQRHNV